MIKEKNTIKKVNSNVIPILGIIICFIFSIWSALWFVTSVLTLRPETLITQWEIQPEKLDTELADKMIIRLKRSVKLNPINAKTHLLLAKYYEILSNNNPEYKNLAEQTYKNTIEHQPTLDYAWARLANFYSKQETIDKNKLLYALSNSMLIGPYERENQKVIIPLIFKHWNLIAESKQNTYQATKIIKHGLHYGTHSKIILHSAKNYQQLAVLAPMLTKKWHKDFVYKHLKE